MNDRSAVTYEHLGELLNNAGEFAQWLGILDSGSVALSLLRRLDNGFAYQPALLDPLWGEAAGGDTSGFVRALARCVGLVQPYLTDEEEPEDLVGVPELQARAGFVVVDTLSGFSLGERLVKASTGLIDAFQYFDELLSPGDAARILGRFPVAMEGDVGPVEAWALERLIMILQTAASDPVHMAVPAVHTLTRRGCDTLAALVTILETEGRP